MLGNFRRARTQIKQFVVMTGDANAFGWLKVGHSSRMADRWLSLR